MTTEEAINYAEGKAAQLEGKMERFESWYGDYVMYSTELEFVSQAITALRAQQENLTKVSQGFSQDQVNAPLTLDELRKMDGEPVWVVPTGETDWSAHWDIFGQGYVTASSDTKRAKMYFLYAEHLGKTWLAYRHKPKEEA